jgi:hypothetical protein
MIAEHAQWLEHLAAMADGRIDETELQAQEQRCAGDARGRAAVGRKAACQSHAAMCELTAYDIMHAVHTMQQARPKTAFRG